MDSTTVGYHVGWLIDGTGQPAAKNRVVAVRDGRFQAVLTLGEAQAQGLPLVDWSGCTMFPGLIDSHVHLVMSGTTDPSLRRRQLDSTDAGRCQAIADHLLQHLTWGVMAVRDGGDHRGDTLRYKVGAAISSTLPVTIASAGRARHAQGRYGKLIGIAVGPEEELAVSAFASDQGRDHLKLVNSGLNSLTQFGVASEPQFDLQALRRAVAAAHKRGLPTMVHANGPLPVKLAIDAGCDSIEHGFFMGEANMRRMASRGTVWVPTAVTMQAYGTYLKNAGWRCDPSFGEVSRRNLEHQLTQIDLARQLGVTLALGTDAGSPGVHHGLAVQTELALFIAAGFSLEEAVQCASRNGARLMGLTDRGTIAPGMRADFSLVQAPPEGLPAALDRIRLRMVQGRIVDPERLQ